MRHIHMLNMSPFVALCYIFAAFSGTHPKYAAKAILFDSHVYRFFCVGADDPRCSIGSAWLECSARLACLAWLTLGSAPGGCSLGSARVYWSAQLLGSTARMLSRVPGVKTRSCFSTRGGAETSIKHDGGMVNHWLHMTWVIVSMVERQTRVRFHKCGHGHRPITS